MYKCEICNQEFNKPTALATHIKYKHTDIEQEKCLICGYEAKPGPFKRHINKIHNLDYQKYMEIYNPDEALDMKDYVVCKICGSRYKSFVSKHIKTFHKMSIDEYLRIYPDAELSSEYWNNLMAKRNQSDKMRQITINHNKSEKMRQVTINKNKDPEFIKKVKLGLHNSEKLSKYMTKKNLESWKDPEYAKKMLSCLDKSTRYGRRQKLFSEVFNKEFSLKSNCEARFVKLCEYLGVNTLEYEPIRISYFIDGIEHTYCPDFLVNNEFIVEVKSDDNYDSSIVNLEKARSAIEYANSNGIKFCWYRDKKDRKITNFNDIVLSSV